MTPLCELASKYGTDKGGDCIDKPHSYTVAYYELLKDRRESTRKVLEIGVGLASCMYATYKTGASMYMWEEFFPNADIFAFDMNPQAMFSAGRIKTFIANQGSVPSLEAAMQNVGKDVDFIVDDGSHHPPHQILTMKTLLPYLAKNGIYAIEDIIVDTKVITDQVPEGYDFKVVECPSKRTCLCGCGGSEKIVIITHKES